MPDLDALAHHPDPYPAYAERRDRGVHRADDGRWVIPGAAAVAAVLGDPGVRVSPSPPADPVRALMARFSDGADHDRRRAVATAALAPLDPRALRDAARDLTRSRLADRDEVELMADVARTVPVASLAEALGLDPDAAVAATRDLALALAPPAGAAPGDASGPVARLTGSLDERRVNTAALLFQAFDATAGLIGNALLAPDRRSVDELVAHTNRYDPSVQRTERFTAEPIDVEGVRIPAGERLLVLLAAANHDPAATDTLTFGTGPRSCPGSHHALALAAGVLDALTAAGVTPTDTEVRYEPRPNLRIPARLPASRITGRGP